MDKINLIENFSSFQGEGPNSGMRMQFFRFKKCSRICKWCDTIVKMRITAEAEYTIEQLQKVIDEEKNGICITGGEPTFDSNFDQTILMLNNLIYPLANIESNGYKLKELIDKVDSKKNVNYMYSPKIFTKEELDIEKNKTLELINYKNVYFKIVVEDNDLIKEYLHFLSNELSIRSDDKFNNMRVYLMPEGRTHDELIKNSGFVFDMCEEYSFNFSSREHIIYQFL